MILVIAFLAVAIYAAPDRIAAAIVVGCVGVLFALFALTGPTRR